MLRSYLIVAGALLFFSISSLAHAGPRLAWDAPQGDTPVTGYKIYYGTVSGNHPTPLSVQPPPGNQTTFSVPGLSDGQTYYFVVRAYNDAGEGPSSGEVQWSQSDVTPPLPPLGVSVQ